MERDRGEALGVVCLLPALLEHAALSSRDLSSSLTLSSCSRESGGRSLEWCSRLALPSQQCTEAPREPIRNQGSRLRAPIVWRLLGLWVHLKFFFKVGCSLPSETPAPPFASSPGGPGIVSSVLPQLANKIPLALEEGPLSLLPIPIMLFHYGPHWSIHSHSQSKLLMA